MNELEDIKLKALLQEMELEKPASNFSYRVMNRILEEDCVLEKIKAERILGKGFWIIAILFIALLLIVFLVSNLGLVAETEVPAFLSKLQGNVNSDYQSFFQKLGTAPLSIAGILIASSILLFIDRFITANMKVFQG
jgi:ABC-type Fe3+ transport system permease subunit